MLDYISLPHVFIMYLHHFVIIYGTNLLTRCPVPVLVFCCCYHSFLAGSGSSLLGGDGLGGNPAGANADQPLPESQAYSEELDPVETRQELTRISQCPSHRFESTRKWMIRNGLGNDDPEMTRFTRNPQLDSKFPEDSRSCAKMPDARR